MQGFRISPWCFYTITTKMSTKPKTETHYEALEISPQATQYEIKSAYYKLSMQYHPDKNKSSSAKRKFQNITDAYDVLSNYNARKKYDRLVIRKQVKPEIVHTSVYKSPIVPTAYSKPNPIFNFDEWTRQHYGDNFQRAIHRKKVLLDMQKMRKERSTLSSNGAYSDIGQATLFSVIICVIWGVFILTRHNEDVKSVKSNSKD